MPAVKATHRIAMVMVQWKYHNRALSRYVWSSRKCQRRSSHGSCYQEYLQKQM